MSRTNVYSSSYVSCYRYRFYTLYKFHNNLPLNCGIASLRVRERVLIMIVADIRTACNLEKHSQGTETMTGSVKQEVFCRNLVDGNGKIWSSFKGVLLGTTLRDACGAI